MRPPYWLLSLAAVAAVVLLLTTAAPVRAQSIAYVIASNGTWSGAPATVAQNPVNWNMFSTSTRIYVLVEWPAIPVEAGEFQFYVSSGASATYNLYDVPPSYTPGTLDWNTQPNLGTLVGTVTGATGWHSIDISDYLNSKNSDFALALVSQTSTLTTIDGVPSLGVVEYTGAVLTRPADPVHCWDMEDALDKTGNYHLTLGNGAVTGVTTGVWDASLSLTSTMGFATAESLPLYTSTADFTVSGWINTDGGPSAVGFDAAGAGVYWGTGGSPTDYKICTDFGISCLEGAGDGGWDYFAGSIAADGSAYLVINQDVYTDTLTAPAATAANYILYSDDARVDQLMWFDQVLSYEEHQWLRNVGRGRSCYEFAPPSTVTTYTITIPMPTPQYTMTLPSGGSGSIYVEASAGELMIAVSVIFLVIVSAVGIFAAYGREVMNRGNSS